MLVGQVLFDRSSKGSRPTANGLALLGQARMLLRAFRRLSDPASRDRPPIRLGCIARAMHTLMPELLHRVYPDLDRPSSGGHSGLRFSLTEGSSTQLLDDVAAGKLDFAILRAVGVDLAGRGVVLDRLYEERTVIICAAANRALTGGRVTLARLAEHDWVLPEAQTASRAAFDRFWGERGFAPVHPLIEARSFETNLALVARTRFLSVAPESVARRHASVGAVRILPVRPAFPASPVMLACHRMAMEDPLLVAFRTAIHEAAAQTRQSLRRSRVEPMQ